MKTEQAVRRKLRQAQFRHLKVLLSDELSKLPQTCLFNEKHRILNASAEPGVKNGAEDPIGLCMYYTGSEGSSAGWSGVICDKDVPGSIDQARECPYWKPRRTKAEIKEGFYREMGGTRASIASKYPDIAALLWVVEDDTSKVGWSWWQRLKLRFLATRPQLPPPEEVVNLDPPLGEDGECE